MSLGLSLVVIIAGALLSAAVITLAVNRLRPQRKSVFTGEGGSPSLRAITTTYALVLAFVLASALQGFDNARQATVAEANAVVSVGNLATRLPPTESVPVLKELSCYADRVANREFSVLRSGGSVPDDNTPLDRLYRALPNLNHTGQGTVSATEAMLTELSTLTSTRDSRIRDARDSLPPLLRIVLIGGGALFLLAVAAVTVPDRPWAQFGILAGLTALVLGMILVIAEVDRPYASGQVRVSEAPMRSALMVVSQHLSRPYCSRFDASGKLLAPS